MLGNGDEVADLFNNTLKQRSADEHIQRVPRSATAGECPLQEALEQVAGQRNARVLSVVGVILLIDTIRQTVYQWWSLNQNLREDQFC